MSTKPILVVDDEAINLATLRQILAPQHPLIFARSGEDCLAAARAHQPALILLDVQMPDLDGYAVCRRLKSDPATEAIPVIFVTALSDVGDEALGFDCGAVDYIVKPVSPALVLARVRTHLSLVRASMLERYVDQLEIQQRKVSRLSRIKSVLSGINSAIVRLRDRQALCVEACRIAVEEGGFAFAWIGLDLDGAGTLVPVAIHGLPPGQLDALAHLLAEGRGHAARDLSYQALKANRAIYCNDLQLAEPGLCCSSRLMAGLRSAIALPLTPGDRALGVIKLTAREPHLFDDDELKLLGELAGDISFALKHIEQEEQVHYLSRHDALTGLPNNLVFLDRLEQLIQSAAASGDAVVTVIANLKHFKRFNDRHGRHVGDQLLKQIGHRLAQAFARSHCVARVSGDGFGLASSCGGEVDVAACLRSFDEVLCQPAVVAGSPVKLAAQYGIAVYPGDGENGEALFRNAEAALKQARIAGVRHATYSAEMNARMNEKLELESQLREALERRQFEVFFQPKVDLHRGCITASEALIRWQHPTRGLVPPSDFIPVAEETGLIGTIGEWVIRAVCEQQASWRERGLRVLPVAINLSAPQFREGRTLGCIESALLDCKLGPEAIELELTETLVMRDVREAERTLCELREAGFHLSLDDFGTGYSSLAYLKLFPFSSVKIDRSFVTDVHRSAEDAAIALAIIAMAHSMKMHVIAEGVETPAQLQFLRSNGCDQMQGFYFSRPVPADEYARMLVDDRQLDLGRGAGATPPPTRH